MISLPARTLPLGYFFILFILFALAVEPSVATAQSANQGSQATFNPSAVWAKAVTAHHKGDYDESIRLTRQWMAYESKRPKPNPSMLALKFGFLADNYIYEDKLDDALAMQSASIKITQNLLGNEHWATIYQVYKKRLIESVKKMSNTDRGRFRSAKKAYDIGKQLRLSGNYIKSKEKLEFAVQEFEILVGKESLRYLETLIQFGITMIELGEISSAQSLHAEALKISRRIIPKYHPLYSSSLGNLSACYSKQGAYQLALPLIQESVELIKKNGTTDNLSYVKTNLSLAAVHDSIGDISESVRITQECLEICERLHGTQHFETGRCYLNLATLSRKQNRYEDSVRYNKLAISVFKRTVGTKNPFYAAAITSLASTNAQLGNYEESLELEKLFVAIKWKLYGKEHREYSVALNNLGNAYLNIENYPKARENIAKAVSLHTKLLRPGHPETAHFRVNLAMVDILQKRFEQALPLLAIATNTLFNEIQQNFVALSERQRIEYVNDLKGTLGLLISTAIQSGHPPEEIYKNVIRWKAMISNQERLERFSLSDQRLDQDRDNLNNARKRLSEIVMAADVSDANRENWITTFYENRLEEEKLEQIIARKSHDLKLVPERAEVSVDEIQRVLKTKDRVFIDFFVYLRDTIFLKGPKKRLREPHLLAFVIRPDQPLQLVELGKLATIEQQIDNWREVLLDQKGIAERGAARKLHQSIWTPLLPHLAEAKVVLVSADGPLHRLSFYSLIDAKSGTRLIEDITIGNVNSAADLIEFSKKETYPRNSMLAVANPSFGHTLIKSEDSWKILFHQSQAIPGTIFELIAIEETHRKTMQKSGTMVSIRDADATESKVKESLNRNSFRYIHLGTHGFFAAPAQIEEKFSSIKSLQPLLSAIKKYDETRATVPMLMGGLKFADSGGDDGILTPLEVKSLNLRNTELVVLSACETGLGGVTKGEGVFGLQRAFHQAGAKCLISTLWSVEDASTSLIMEHFYRNIFVHRMTKLEALRQAQLFVYRHPLAVHERRREIAKYIFASRIGQTGKNAKLLDLVEKEIRDSVEANLMKSEKTTNATDKARSPIGEWSGFVLSGQWN